jgi:hypothetical protein
MPDGASALGFLNRGFLNRGNWAAFLDAVSFARPPGLARPFGRVTSNSRPSERCILGMAFAGITLRGTRKLKKEKEEPKMIQHVSKPNVIAAMIMVVVIALFSFVPPATAANHYVYHHHSKLRGALVGGAGGALVGGLAGHGKGALIGGAAGAGAGYLVQRYRNHRERRRIAHYR